MVRGGLAAAFGECSVPSVMSTVPTWSSVGLTTFSASTPPPTIEPSAGGWAELCGRFVLCGVDLGGRVTGTLSLGESAALAGPADAPLTPYHVTSAVGCMVLTELPASPPCSVARRTCTNDCSSGVSSGGCAGSDGCHFAAMWTAGARDPCSRLVFTPASPNLRRRLCIIAASSCACAAAASRASCSTYARKPSLRRAGSGVPASTTLARAAEAGRRATWALPRRAARLVVAGASC